MGASDLDRCARANHSREEKSVILVPEVPEVPEVFISFNDQLIVFLAFALIF